MKSLTVYTDGAYSPMRDQGGIGIVFVENNEIIKKYNKSFTETTNNKCELLAVIYALNAISAPIKSLDIYSDSQYVIGCATLGWKRKKNVELWQTYDKVYAKASQFCPEIKFNWVKGHDVSEFNNLADELAVEASKEYETKKK